MAFTFTSRITTTHILQQIVEEPNNLPISLSISLQFRDMHRMYRNLAVFLISVCTILLSTTFLTSRISGTAQEVTWNTYNDGNGEFTIDYPSEWDIENATETEAPFDVEFWYDDGHDYDTVASVMVATSPNSTFLSTGDMFNYQDGIPNSTIKQDTECSNYKIDGIQACSSILSETNPGQKSRTDLMVGALDDNGIETWILFYASDDVYEFFKPVFDHMVNSFKFNSST